MKKTCKHRLHVEAPIVAERALIQVGLQITAPDRMIDAADSSLYQAPESFHGVRVNVANDIHLLAVLDAMMPIAAIHVRDSIVSVQFVAEHGAFWHDVLPHHAEQGGTFHVGGNERLNPALAFHDADHGSFLDVASGRTASAAFPLAAHVSFIHLHALAAFAAEWPRILVQHGANLLKHPPCGFVGHPRFPFNLFSGNSSATPDRSHRRETDGRSLSWCSASFSTCDS